MPDRYSRRNFLKLGAALLAGGASVALPPGIHKAQAMGRGKPFTPPTGVKSYCPFCQVRCTYTAQVTNGKVESLVGEPGNPWTHGSMCPKGMSLVELIQSPHRITEPMLRQPDGTFRRIPYEEAIALVAQKILECKEKHGDKAGDRIAMTAPLWDCRESELAAAMTMHTAGSVHILPAGEVCISSASNMLGLMTGVNTSTTTVNEICNCTTLVLWGANINELYPPYADWLDKARQAGVNIIYIDPRKTRTSQWATMQLQPRPGTDGSLAIGALRYILDAKAYEEEKALALIPEIDLLAEDAAPYTPDVVLEHTGVSLQDQDTFYRAIASSERTIIWLGGSLSRYTNGIQSLRAIMLLQGLRDNMAGSGKGLLTMEGGKPGGEDEFEEHLFGPDNRPKMNFRRLRIGMERGNIDVLFLNSSYRRYPDCKGVRAALEKVPFIVHRAFFLTEESEVADLVVPAAFGLESAGSHFGAEKQAVWRDKAVDAPGSCVSDWQFYRDVGMRLDPENFPYFKDPEELFRKFVSVVPSWKGITLERLKKAQGGIVWPLYAEGAPEQLGTSFRDGKLLTPNGTMPVKDRVFGRITWNPPKGNPHGNDRDEAYPLVFMQGKVLTHWQQTLTNFSAALAQFSSGRYVNIHPETAGQFGLRQGDLVRIETATGSVEARVEILDTIIPGIIFTPSHFARSAPHSQNRSEHINTIVPNFWDRISSQTNGVGCTLKKV